MNTTTTDNLPETILSLADFSVIYELMVEIDDDQYDYNVVDKDGNQVEGFDDEADAIEEATRLQADLDAERKDERLESLREQVGDLAAECEDESRLRMILAILKK